MECLVMAIYCRNPIGIILRTKYCNSYWVPKPSTIDFQRAKSNKNPIRSIMLLLAYGKGSIKDPDTFTFRIIHFSMHY